MPQSASAFGCEQFTQLTIYVGRIKPPLQAVKRGSGCSYGF